MIKKYDENWEIKSIYSKNQYFRALLYEMVQKELGEFFIKKFSVTVKSLYT